MTRDEIARTRRRIFNAIDAIHRIDNARGSPSFQATTVARRHRERQQEQREEIASVFDDLVAKAEKLERVEAELEAARTLLFRLTYGEPSAGRGHGSNTGGTRPQGTEPEFHYAVYRQGDHWRIMDRRTGHTHWSQHSTAAEAKALVAIWARLDKNDDRLRIGREGHFTKIDRDWQ